MDDGYMRCLVFRTLTCMASTMNAEIYFIFDLSVSIK
jgi:hypothetical protein